MNKSPDNIARIRAAMIWYFNQVEFLLKEDVAELLGTLPNPRNETKVFIPFRVIDNYDYEHEAFALWDTVKRRFYSLRLNVDDENSIAINLDEL